MLKTSYVISLVLILLLCEQVINAPVPSGLEQRFFDLIDVLTQNGLVINKKAIKLMDNMVNEGLEPSEVIKDSNLGIFDAIKNFFNIFNTKNHKLPEVIHELVPVVLSTKYSSAAKIWLGHARLFLGPEWGDVVPEYTSESSERFSLHSIDDAIVMVSSGLNELHENLSAYLSIYPSDSSEEFTQYNQKHIEAVAQKWLRDLTLSSTSVESDPALLVPMDDLRSQLLLHGVRISPDSDTLSNYELFLQVEEILEREISLFARRMLVPSVRIAFLISPMDEYVSRSADPEVFFEYIEMRNIIILEGRAAEKRARLNGEKKMPNLASDSTILESVSRSSSSEGAKLHSTEKTSPKTKTLKSESHDSTPSLASFDETISNAMSVLVDSVVQVLQRGPSRQNDVTGVASADVAEFGLEQFSFESVIYSLMAIDARLTPEVLSLVPTRFIFRRFYESFAQRMNTTPESIMRRSHTLVEELHQRGLRTALSTRFTGVHSVDDLADDGAAIEDMTVLMSLESIVLVDGFGRLISDPIFFSDEHGPAPVHTEAYDLWPDLTPSSIAAETKRRQFGAHFDFTVPVSSSAESGDLNRKSLLDALPVLLRYSLYPYVFVGDFIEGSDELQRAHGELSTLRRGFLKYFFGPEFVENPPSLDIALESVLVFEDRAKHFFAKYRGMLEDARVQKLTKYANSNEETSFLSDDELEAIGSLLVHVDDLIRDGRLPSNIMNPIPHNFHHGHYHHHHHDFHHDHDHHHVHGEDLLAFEAYVWCGSPETAQLDDNNLMQRVKFWGDNAVDNVRQIQCLVQKYVKLQESNLLTQHQELYNIAASTDDNTHDSVHHHEDDHHHHFDDHHHHLDDHHDHQHEDEEDDVDFASPRAADPFRSSDAQWEPYTIEEFDSLNSFKEIEFPSLPKIYFEFSRNEVMTQMSDPNPSKYTFTEFWDPVMRPKTAENLELLAQARLHGDFLKNSQQSFPQTNAHNAKQKGFSSSKQSKQSSAGAQILEEDVPLTNEEFSNYVDYNSAPVLPLHRYELSVPGTVPFVFSPDFIYLFPESALTADMRINLYAYEDGLLTLALLHLSRFAGDGIPRTVAVVPSPPRSPLDLDSEVKRVSSPAELRGAEFRLRAGARFSLFGSDKDALLALNDLASRGSAVASRYLGLRYLRQGLADDIVKAQIFDHQLRQWFDFLSEETHHSGTDSRSDPSSSSFSSRLDESQSRFSDSHFNLKNNLRIPEIPKFRPSSPYECAAGLSHIFPLAAADTSSPEIVTRGSFSAPRFWEMLELPGLAATSQEGVSNVRHLDRMLEQQMNNAEDVGDAGANNMNDRGAVNVRVAAQLGELMMHGFAGAGVAQDPLRAFRLLTAAAGGRDVIGQHPLVNNNVNNNHYDLDPQNVEGPNGYPHPPGHQAPVPPDAPGHQAHVPPDAPGHQAHADFENYNNPVNGNGNNPVNINNNNNHNNNNGQINIDPMGNQQPVNNDGNEDINQMHVETDSFSIHTMSFDSPITYVPRARVLTALMMLESLQSPEVPSSDGVPVDRTHNITWALDVLEFAAQGGYIGASLSFLLQNRLISMSQVEKLVAKRLDSFENGLKQRPKSRASPTADTAVETEEDAFVTDYSMFPSFLLEWFGELFVEEEEQEVVDGEVLEFSTSDPVLDNVYQQLLQTAGLTEAIAALGWVFQSGALPQRPKNPTLACYYLRQAARAGVPSAHSNLAALYLDGGFHPSDLARDVRALEASDFRLFWENISLFSSHTHESETPVDSSSSPLNPEELSLSHLLRTTLLPAPTMSLTEGAFIDEFMKQKTTTMTEDEQENIWEGNIDSFYTLDTTPTAAHKHLLRVGLDFPPAAYNVALLTLLAWDAPHYKALEKIARLPKAPISLQKSNYFASTTQTVDDSASDVRDYMGSWTEEDQDLNEMNDRRMFQPGSAAGSCARALPLFARVSERGAWRDRAVASHSRARDLLSAAESAESSLRKILYDWYNVIESGIFRIFNFLYYRTRLAFSRVFRVPMREQAKHVVLQGSRRSSYALTRQSEARALREVALMNLLFLDTIFSTESTADLVALLLESEREMRLQKQLADQISAYKWTSTVPADSRSPLDIQEQQTMEKRYHLAHFRNVHGVADFLRFLLLNVKIVARALKLAIDLHVHSVYAMDTIPLPLSSDFPFSMWEPERASMFTDLDGPNSQKKMYFAKSRFPHFLFEDALVSVDTALFSSSFSPHNTFGLNSTEWADPRRYLRPGIVDIHGKANSTLLGPQNIHFDSDTYYFEVDYAGVPAHAAPSNKNNKEGEEGEILETTGKGLSKYFNLPISSSAFVMETDRNALSAPVNLGAFLARQLQRGQKFFQDPLLLQLLKYESIAENAEFQPPEDVLRVCRVARSPSGAALPAILRPSVGVPTPMSRLPDEEFLRNGDEFARADFSSFQNEILLSSLSSYSADALVLPSMGSTSSVQGQLRNVAISSILRNSANSADSAFLLFLRAVCIAEQWHAVPACFRPHRTTLLFSNSSEALEEMRDRPNRDTFSILDFFSSGASAAFAWRSTHSFSVNAASKAFNYVQKGFEEDAHSPGLLTQNVDSPFYLSDTNPHNFIEIDREHFVELLLNREQSKTRSKLVWSEENLQAVKNIREFDFQLVDSYYSNEVAVKEILVLLERAAHLGMPHALHYLAEGLKEGRLGRFRIPQIPQNSWILMEVLEAADSATVSEVPFFVSRLQILFKMAWNWFYFISETFWMVVSYIREYPFFSLFSENTISLQDSTLRFTFNDARTSEDPVLVRRFLLQQKIWKRLFFVTQSLFDLLDDAVIIVAGEYRRELVNEGESGSDLGLGDIVESLDAEIRRIAEEIAQDGPRGNLEGAGAFDRVNEHLEWPGFEAREPLLQALDAPELLRLRQKIKKNYLDYFDDTLDENGDPVSHISAADSEDEEDLRINSARTPNLMHDVNEDGQIDPLDSLILEEDLKNKLEIARAKRRTFGILYLSDFDAKVVSTSLRTLISVFVIGYVSLFSIIVPMWCCPVRNIIRRAN